jgi:hypothetical protein
MGVTGVILHMADPGMDWSDRLNLCDVWETVEEAQEIAGC